MSFDASKTSARNAYDADVPPNLLNFMLKSWNSKARKLPAVLPERTLVTVGVAPRWAGSGDDPASVTEHAAIALRLADLATERLTTPEAAGAWRVWQRD